MLAAQDNRRFVLGFTLCRTLMNRLRRKVFTNGGRWRDPNPKLYLEMKEILQAAQVDLNELEG